MKISYTTVLSNAQFDQAGDLIDAGEQLAEELDRSRLRRASVLVAALNSEGDVIGVGAVKERQGDVAETGYLVVHPDCRRQGIGQELTKRRLDEARRLGMALVYTN